MCASFSTLKHAQDGPSCEEMSDVYHPPSSLPNMHAHANTQGHREHACTGLHWHTHTEAHILFKHHTKAEISLVRGCMGLIFASPWSWWDLVWHSLAHVRSPTVAPRVKPITFLGSRKTCRVKGSSFVPVLTLIPNPPTPLFYYSFLSLLIHLYAREV